MVSNQCESARILRFTSENRELTATDQLKGMVVRPRETIDVTAIHPPSGGIVLRTSLTDGQPILVVPVEMDEGLSLTIDATLAALLSKEQPVSLL
jgi:hypothetical protein